MAMTLFARNLIFCAISATASACSRPASWSVQNASAAWSLRSDGSVFHSCDGRVNAGASVMIVRYVNIASMPTLMVEGHAPVVVDDGMRLVNAIEQRAGVDI